MSGLFGFLPPPGGGRSLFADLPAATKAASDSPAAGSLPVAVPATTADAATAARSSPASETNVPGDAAAAPAAAAAAAATATAAAAATPATAPDTAKRPPTGLGGTHEHRSTTGPRGQRYRARAVSPSHETPLHTRAGACPDCSSPPPPPRVVAVRMSSTRERQRAACCQAPPRRRGVRFGRGCGSLPPPPKTCFLCLVIRHAAQQGAGRTLSAAGLAPVCADSPRDAKGAEALRLITAATRGHHGLKKHYEDRCGLLSTVVPPWRTAWTD